MLKYQLSTYIIRIVGMHFIIINAWASLTHWKHLSMRVMIDVYDIFTGKSAVRQKRRQKKKRICWMQCCKRDSLSNTSLWLDLVCELFNKTESWTQTQSCTLTTHDQRSIWTWVSVQTWITLTFHHKCIHEFMFLSQVNWCIKFRKTCGALTTALPRRNIRKPNQKKICTKRISEQNHRSTVSKRTDLNRFLCMTRTTVTYRHLSCRHARSTLICVLLP